MSCLYVLIEYFFLRFFLKFFGIFFTTKKICFWNIQKYIWQQCSILKSSKKYEIQRFHTNWHDTYLLLKIEILTPFDSNERIDNGNQKNFVPHAILNSLKLLNSKGVSKNCGYRIFEHSLHSITGLVSS